jgi:hypothetical protein
MIKFFWDKFIFFLLLFGCSFVYKVERFCRTSIGGAHGHDNLKKKKKTRNKEDMAIV